MKSPAKILLIRNTHPDSYGGAETYQLMLASELRANNYDPIIITSSRQLLQKSRDQGFIAISAPYLRQQNWSSVRNLLLPIYFFWQLYLYFWYRRLFNKYRPLAVNVQSRDDWIAASIAARRQGIKVLWTDHMDFSSWVLTNVQKKYKNFIGQFILREARRVFRIIFISNVEYELFERQVKPRQFSNLTVIRNGVVDVASQYALKAAPAQTACYVGRIVDYKGINELSRAWEAVNKSYPAAKLHVYGTGDQALIQQLRSTPGVIYQGFTDSPQQSISTASVFILPSYREGLSLSLLDAAMLGRSIIASDVGGNPEVVLDHKTGLLVPAKNSEALAGAIIELFDDPHLAQTLAKNARRHYEQSFNFSKIVKEQFIPLLQEGAA